MFLIENQLLLLIYGLIGRNFINRNISGDKFKTQYYLQHLFIVEMEIIFLLLGCKRR